MKRKVRRRESDQGDMSKMWEKNSNAFQMGFLRAHMVCCKLNLTLMTTHFVTIDKNTSLNRC